MKARQTAHEKYISSIYTYWKYYYEIQKITLYDFNKNESITINISN